MEAWERYLKKEDAKEHSNKNRYFRAFGTLSGDSVVTDIYNKKYKKDKKRKRNSKK